MKSVLMKSVLGVLLLPAIALAMLVAPLSNSSTHSATLFGVDIADTTDIDAVLIPGQISPKAVGVSCADEGAWFCMSDNFQRCASGQWSIVESCAPGTQCAPLGLTHNASQPAFGVYDGSTGTVTTDASTTTFGIEPVTKTTTFDVFVTEKPSVLPSTEISSPVPASTTIGTLNASSISSTASPGAPKADTSEGTRIDGVRWSTMGVMFLSLSALICSR